MPLQSVRLRPGINTNATPTLNEGGWSDSQFIRWREGWPEKAGGWLQLFVTSVGSAIRRLLHWHDLEAEHWLAIGAEESLEVSFDEGAPQEITPQFREDDVAVDFTTTLGSSVVTIVAAASDLSIFSVVDIQTPVSVGGLILFGLYPVNTVIDQNTFSIVAVARNTGLPEEATASVANGGAVPEFTTVNASAIIDVAFEDHGLSVGEQVSYPIPTTVGGIVLQGIYTVFAVAGVDDYSIIADSPATSNDVEDMNGGDVHFYYYTVIGPVPVGGGWGSGTWGSGTWGTGTTSPYTGGDPIETTNWALDNFGEILIACPVNGPIFWWRPNSGFETARIIGEGPAINGGCFVAMPQQQIIAWASEFNGVQDPLLVRWCHVSDFSIWVGSATNQAGSFRLGRGNEIRGALQGPNSSILFTDLGVWLMSYIGPSDVYSFDEIGMGCGLVGRNAAVVAPDGVYWMGFGNFFRLRSGGVEILPCPVWNSIFEDLDHDNVDKITCGVDSIFGEVKWFVPLVSDGTGEPSIMVKYNYIEGTWDTSPMERTAWIDWSGEHKPTAADSAGYIYHHEDGYDNNGASITAYVQSGWFMVTEGDPLVFIDWVIPDFQYGLSGGDQDAMLSVTFEVVDYPWATPVTYGPFSMSQAIDYVNLRARGRQMRMKIESSDQGSFWRLGNFRYRGAIDGRR